jgi:hypothetical protein
MPIGDNQLEKIGFLWFCDVHRASIFYPPQGRVDRVD